MSKILIQGSRETKLMVEFTVLFRGDSLMHINHFYTLHAAQLASKVKREQLGELQNAAS